MKTVSPLLTSAKKAYLKAEASAWNAYQDASAPAKKAAQKAEATAWKAYQKTAARAKKSYLEAIRKIGKRKR